MAPSSTRASASSRGTTPTTPSSTGSRSSWTSGVGDTQGRGPRGRCSLHPVVDQHDRLHAGHRAASRADSPCCWHSSSTAGCAASTSSGRSTSSRWSCRWSSSRCCGGSSTARPVACSTGSSARSRSARSDPWTGSATPALALPAVMLMSMWQAVGFQMVIWLAGLQSIPTHLYEAAALDGAGRWAQFKHVTWPGLRNTAVFIFITITIAAFGLFTQIDVMTRGGPLDATRRSSSRPSNRASASRTSPTGRPSRSSSSCSSWPSPLVQRRLTRERPDGAA